MCNNASSPLPTNSVPTAAAPPLLRLAPTRTRVVLVQANVSESAVQLERSRLLIGTPSSPEADGAWVIEGHDADGTLLFQHRTHEGRFDHVVDVRPLSAAIPLTPSAEAALATITIRGPLGQRATRAFNVREP